MMDTQDIADRLTARALTPERIRKLQRLLSGQPQCDELIALLPDEAAAAVQAQAVSERWAERNRW